MLSAAIRTRQGPGKYRRDHCAPRVDCHAGILDPKIWPRRGIMQEANRNINLAATVMSINDDRLSPEIARKAREWINRAEAIYGNVGTKIGEGTPKKCWTRSIRDSPKNDDWFDY